MLQHWGWDQLAEEINRRHELARLAADWIREQPRLRLINPDVSHNAVAFMYIPEGVDDAEQLNRLNRALHERLNMDTKFFVHAFSARDDDARVRSDRGSIFALRMMFGNPLSDWAIVRECLETISKIGYELAADRLWQSS